MAIHGQYAFIGLSRIRETSVFGGIPIAEKRDELKCGVGVVDLLNGRVVATFQFQNCVEENFAVELLPASVVRQFVVRSPGILSMRPTKSGSLRLQRRNSETPAEIAGSLERSSATSGCQAARPAEYADSQQFSTASAEEWCSSC